MDSTALVNLSPVAVLMVKGILIAIGPLAWVWLRNRRAAPAQRLRALTVLTLFLTFDLVLFGAFTRLTDSGLGCPDWPGCYGSASPIGAKAQIAAAQTAMPTGPVTPGKAWIEMIHRYLATGVGVLILTLAVATWWARRKYGAPTLAAARAALDVPPPEAVALRPVPPCAGRPGAAGLSPGGAFAPKGGPAVLSAPTPAFARPNVGELPVLSLWWPLLTLVWVCIQGAFGALTVTMKLFPAIVTLHLLGGMVLLALLCAQAVRYAQAGGVPLVQISAGARWLLVSTFAALWLQVALGGWVSTNYAVLACAEFPTCQGSWWPPMDAQGFELWRPLGQTGAGANISFAALTAIHYAHRLAAYVVFVLLGVLAWRLRHALSTQARWVAGLALAQLLTGLSNVVLGWPLLAAVLHTGGAAALVVVLTWALCASRTAAAPEAAPSYGAGRLVA